MSSRDGRATLRDVFEIMRDPHLTEHEGRLWALYRSYDTGEGAWPGDDVLAGHMGKKIRSVESYRAGLIQKGYLVGTFRGPPPAAYRAVIPEAPQDLADLDPRTPVVPDVVPPPDPRGAAVERLDAGTAHYS